MAAKLKIPIVLESRQAEIASHVREILFLLGEDPKREGLLDTPMRVAKAMQEMTSGLSFDPSDVLSKVFEEGSDEMVIIRNLPMVSLCEHHLLPFRGFCTIGYIPRDKKILGLSKFARLLKGFAARPQVQERLTSQIADALQEHLDPIGVGVLIKASHLCMEIRGVQSSGETITSAMIGALREDEKARAEFLHLATT